MRRVTLTAARRQLGELIRNVESGETIVLTRRGKPVAQIAPASVPTGRQLPDLTEFRASLDVKGVALSETVIAGRDGERY